MSLAPTRSIRFVFGGPLVSEDTPPEIAAAGEAFIAAYDEHERAFREHEEAYRRYRETYERKMALVSDLQQAVGKSLDWYRIGSRMIRQGRWDEEAIFFVDDDRRNP